MKVVNTIEYYAACPQCGAANAGNVANCEYCGSLLIKRSVQETVEGNYDLESQYAQEDAYLPEIDGHFCGKDTFLVLFCSLFGGIFLLVPTTLFLAFLGAGIMEVWLVFFFLIFWVIGGTSFAIMFVRLGRKMKCKNGEIIQGEVRRYENSIVRINNVPAQNIYIKVYMEGAYKILVLNTGETRRRYIPGTKVRLRRYKNCYMFEQ